MRRTSVTRPSRPTVAESAARGGGRLRKMLLVLAGFLLLIAAALWFTARTSPVARATAQTVLHAPEVARRVGPQRFAVLVSVQMSSAGTRLCYLHDYWVVGERGGAVVGVQARTVNFSSEPPEIVVLDPAAGRSGIKDCARGG